MRDWYQHRSDPAQPGHPRHPAGSFAPRRLPRWRAWLVLPGLLLTLSPFLSPALTAAPRAFSFTNFVTEVTHNQVKTASIGPNGQVSGRLANGETYTSQVPTAIPDAELASQLLGHKVQVTSTAEGGSALGLVFGLLPLLLLVALFVWVGRRSRAVVGGVTNIGRSKAHVYDVDDRPTTRFKNVAGYAGVKQEVAEVVDFLKHPDKYRNAGAVGPRGVLMVGPPGTGKTLMARAVAGEAGTPFLALTGSSFVEMFVGVGAARVRDLFADARKKAPAIIFIDELDAIGGRRGTALLGGNDEREHTLNQLLAEMDGFDPATGVVVIAATNRPESLDPALLRPGRFDRTVESPPQPGRTQGHPGRAQFRQEAGGRCRPGRGRSGHAGVCRGRSGQLGQRSSHRGRAPRPGHCDGGRFPSGPRPYPARDGADASNALLPDEKHAVAVHESGHSLVAALCLHADPVAKVTILPAGQALGVTEQLPVADRHLYQESYLYDSLAVHLAGRAAEVLVLGEASTGAANDLAGATQLAAHMVRDWGMSPLLGPVGLSSHGPGYLSVGRGRAPRPR